MTDIRTEPITDASVWQGQDLQPGGNWEYTFTDAHHAELAQALEAVGAVPLHQLDVSRFQLPALMELMGAVRHELQQGCGFVLMHGFPIQDHSYSELDRLYWGLGSLIGPGVTQNSEAGLVHYVTDGKFRPAQGKRGVGRPGRVGLHVDLSDCAGLLCLRQAPGDPPSRLASSMHVYNELLRHHPEALPRLYQGFEWDRQDEHGPGESPTSGYRVPVYSQHGGRVSCRYNRSWIRRALQRNGEDFTAEEARIFDFMDQTADASCFEFPFHAGDIQFANNYTVLHGRAGHEEVLDENQKRVLIRLWLDFEESRGFVDEGVVRYGVVRHGQLGWTAQDLAAGRNQAPRSRTPEGVVVS